MPFITIADAHEYYTRQQGNIRQPFAKHEYAKRCIRFDLPRIINNTPTIILDKVDTHNLNGFSWYIKKYFLNNYQDTCNIRNCYICSRN